MRRENMNTVSKRAANGNRPASLSPAATGTHRRLVMLGVIVPSVPALPDGAGIRQRDRLRENVYATVRSTSIPGFPPAK